jgi:hypothetical protein
MPNTLGHIGVQGPVTRLLIRGADARWIVLGCLLPDIPWIFCRIAVRLVPQWNSYDIQLYAVVQATLAFCLLLSGALALVSAKPRQVFGILALNSLLHLLLDAVEVKWGNGVHLFAPFSWKMLNLGLIWSESVPSLALTGLGLGFAAWCCLRRTDPHRPPSWGTPGRRAAAAGLLAVYLLAPLLLRSLPERADNHFLATLKDRSRRPGKYLEYDRGRVVRTASGDFFTIFSGESLRLLNAPGAEAGSASLRGRFEDERTLRVLEIHHHPGGVRDAATYVGIALIGLIWLLGAGFAAPKSGARPSNQLASGL